MQATSGRVYLGSARFTGPGDGRLLISAFTPAGRLDNTWAGDGTLNTDINANGLGDLAVQSDGKVLALARASSGATLARFNTNGTFDTTFGGGDGRVTLANGNQLALAPGGKIVVAGNSAPGYAVARFNADGTPDPTFGGDGDVVVSSGITDHAVSGPQDMTVLSDGDVVVVGFVDSPDDEPGWDGFVARLNADGSLDTGFDGDGRLIRDSGFVDDEITAVEAGPGGKVFIAPSEGEIWARPVLLNPDGAEDTSFHAPVYRAPEPRIRDMHLMSDGKLVVTGDDDALRDDGHNTFMHRYNADGSIDGTFGGYRFHRPIGSQSALAPDGKVVVADARVSDRGRVARYLATGGTTTTTIQAEHGQLSGAQVRRDHRGYTGSGYVDFINNTGDTAAWTVPVQTTGNHTLTFRYANGSATPRVMRLFVDESGAAPRDVSFNPTGSWSTWRTVTLSVPMRAAGQSVGLNVVTLQAIGNNGPNIDYLTVRRPTPQPPVPSTLQAEDGRLGGAAFVSTLNGGYTGRGYVDFVQNTGDFVEWVVNSSFNLPPRLFITYANGAASNRSLRLRINGQVIEENIVFAPTGSWSSWRQISVLPTSPLRVGNNTIRLEANGSRGPNIDKVEITF